MRERTVLLGHTDEGPVAVEPLRLDAAVLKVNQQSARVRIVRLRSAGRRVAETFRNTMIGAEVGSGGPVSAREYSFALTRFTRRDCSTFPAHRQQVAARSSC